MNETTAHLITVNREIMKGLF